MPRERLVNGYVSKAMLHRWPYNRESVLPELVPPRALGAATDLAPSMSGILKRERWLDT